MSGVLVDTSVWVAHFRQAEPRLQSLLSEDRVLSHPLIVLEIACGTPPAPRARTLSSLQALQQSAPVTPEETLSFIATHRLHDSGCGAIDLCLLASARMTPHTSLWTLDRNLAALARRLGVLFQAARA